MAVDTQEKRMNAVGVGRPYLRSKLPGANDQPWRIASGNGYGANTIAAAVVAALFNLAAGQSRVDGASEGQSYLFGALQGQGVVDGAVEGQAEPT